MNHLLSCGEPLSSFAVSNPEFPFPTATSYPDFFTTHLVDPNRIIKIFKDDPNANERVFYYQYLRICENYEDPTSQERIQNMKEFVMNEDLVFLFPDGMEENQPQLYSDSQFKRLIVQFMDTINEGELSLDEALSTYPIINDVFVYLMRTLLIYNEKAQNFDQYVDRNETFAYLSSIFDIQLELFENCIKFTDADIFVYEEVAHEVYMAYVQDGSEQEDNEEMGTNQIQQIKRNNQMYMSNNSSVYEFVDFTHPHNQENGLKLTSTMQLSSDFVNQITEMKEEEAREEEQLDQDEEQELKDELQMEIKAPQRVDVPSLKPEQEEEEDQASQIQEFDEKSPIKLLISETQPLKVNQDYLVTQPSLDNIPTKEEPFSPSLPPTVKEQDKIQQTPLESNYQNQPPIEKKVEIKFVQSKYETSQFSKSIQNIQMSATSYSSYQNPIKKEQFPFNLPESPTKIPRITQTPGSPSKQPRLNVTLQFTSSFLTEKIPEPFRSSIQKTKEKARAYRSSLKKVLI